MDIILTIFIKFDYFFTFSSLITLFRALLHLIKRLIAAFEYELDYALNYILTLACLLS